MKIFKIHTKQKLPITIEEGWGFLSNPKNLSCITPNYMKFKITDCDFKPVYQGQIIQYTVRPLLNIPLKWVTEITHVVNENYFVDEQRFGPYSLWHHKHFLREIDGGIEMEDIIHYKIPLGFIGEFLNFLFIKNQLKEIFEYRKNKLIEIFGEIS
ncbi:MAG: SRPBCC family protein [Bacteroidota bacterium]|jgi:ligand-binding SRPBCC domain-containing protein|nr:SRPBCC family protein [Bacteroidota bacterium]MEC8601839.1 SRPBCC family protein [Bacteroidota bacterium]MEE2604736.1 SRPBCC family protein [Bacteroidota bacterium]|tara:strand:- start:409 stop:873 length:465 start_codon:yes stop_codon:yes gene_type:complete